ncbi:hypothetical protein SOCEGT47_008160 [Sorangium cellulosum]|uniref:Anti-anti-sigma factor n=1 Tax=Sorangium cellulosum TaxID=56 RepID=A0A4P2PUR2_SORCE|nr:PAS domain-containing protein [Sorangium cellulosum]AUX20348.1 hypothetical protein SOCEGT47_008160 [Sorangium cellulosum]
MNTQGLDEGLAAENARLRARVAELERGLGRGAPNADAQAAPEDSIPFAAVFDLIPTPLFVYRPDGLAAAVNASCCRWYNFTREDIVGRYNVLQDPEAAAQGFIEPFSRAVAGEATVLPATPYVIRGGSQVGHRCMLEATYLPLRDETGVRFVVVMVSDVTAHKEAEAQQRRSAALLEAIIDNAPLVIYARDQEGRYTVANRQLAAIFGRSRSELLGENPRAFLPGPVADRFEEQDRDAMAADAPITLEERLERDGRTRVFVGTRFALRDEDGEVTGVCGISTDITARVQAEEENRRMQEQMLRVQEETLRSISTPLLPIAPGVLVVPLVGKMSRARADQVIEALLLGVSSQQASIAIFDVTGVSEAGAEVTDALVRAARSVRLLGAEIVITGIRPSVAQTLVQLEAELGGIVTRGTLERGVAYALGARGRPGAAHRA